MIGKTISHYKILEKLGEGGMGVVYKAEDTKLERTVALKFLTSRSLGTEDEKIRFAREAKAAAALDHPNICTVHEIDEADGQTFIAMAYVEGRSLAEIIKSRPLAVGEAVGIATQIAEGLQKAHERGIIHRDIKSANIMVTDDGQPKIMDFGLAKLTTKTRITDTATVMGTVAYMSPEQAQGESVDHRTDVWSLGVILYEMLTGEIPFDAPSDAALLHKIIYDEPPDVRTLKPDVPAGLSVVLSKAMAKSRGDRYAGISEFLKDLRTFESLKTEKPSPGPIRAAKLFSSKWARIAIAAAAVVVVAVIGLVAILSGRKPQTAVPPEAPELEQPIRFCTSADGTRIAYAALGNGPPLVRVLGWFTHLEYEWTNPLLRTVIDADTARFFLVRYDARGMGLSDRHVSDFSLEAQVSDLEAVVDALGLERFILYALSQGGPAAITYTVRHPERVSHLILYGSFARVGWLLDTEEGRQEFDASKTLMLRGWDSDAPAYRQFFTGMFMPDAVNMESIRTFNELQKISTSGENAVALCTAMREMDVTDLLPQVTVPTLVIHLKGDAAVPFEVGRKLATGIPGARFLPVDGRNHALSPYDPAAQTIGRAVAEFLTETAQVSPKAESAADAPAAAGKTYSSIAVLPFVDMSPGKDQEYFCDGLSETLINELTQVEDLRVIARTSAFSFKGRNIDMRDIGSALSVETILEGSIQKAGERVRITAQLIDTANGHHLWSDRYDRNMKDIFAIQDEISNAIVDKLRLKLSAGERAKLATRQAVDPEIYDLYLKGMYFWNKYTPEGLQKAFEFFNKVVEKDPDCALGYSGLAGCYNLMPALGSVSPKELYSKAREHALRAIELDDSLALAHTALGWIKTVYDWDWAGGEKEFRRALELNPGNVQTHTVYTQLLAFTGRFDEAVAEAERALELDPFSPGANHAMAWACTASMRYDRALEHLQQTMEMFPDFPWLHINMGGAYLGKSMYEEALGEFARERAISGGWNGEVEHLIGITYALMGRKDEAQRVLDDFLRRSEKTYVPPTFIARLYFTLGNNEKGFEWMEKGYEHHDYYLCWSKIDPGFEELNLRSDPRYIAMLKKINLEP